MKKFFALMSCVMPFGAAVAAPIVIDPATNTDANVMTGFNVPSDNYARIISGAGLLLGTGGMSANSLYVGKNSTDPVDPTGEVFIEPAAFYNNTYTIRSDGNIAINGAVEIQDGYTLGIEPNAQGGTIDNVSFGSINTTGTNGTGAIIAGGINTFTSGSITSGGNIDLTVNALNVNGTFDSTAGNKTINVTNAFGVTGDFINDGNGTIEVNTGSLSLGGFQNKTGSVTIVSNGDINTSGNFENSNASVNVTGADMVVGGTMKNDSNSGEMVLNLASLNVTGGAGVNPSFVNKGDLYITVTGETSVANGFDLSGMQATNKFSLKTGTLNLGGGADSLSQVFENNNLTSFELVVSGGAITANNITNGQTNSAANMTLTAGAGGITANTIQNYGDSLYVSTMEDSGGNITITNPTGTSIYGKVGSTTTVIADGVLDVSGAVSNAGTMILNGNEIKLASTSNTGDLTIAAQTDPTGKITLSGGVSNSDGTTTVSARQIQINGVVVTTGGTTNILGSDSNDGASVKVGGIEAQGGVTNLDALVHSATIGGDLFVGGGAFNTGINTHNLNVGGGVQVNGDLTLSGANSNTAGNFNIRNSGNNRFVLTSDGQINIDQNVVATDGAIARSATLVADVIEIGGDVTAANLGNVAFGDADSGTLTVTGDVTANNGGTVEIYSNATTLGSLSGNGLFVMHGDSVFANDGAINVSNGIWYDGTTPTVGMIINGTNELTLQTITAGNDVSVTGGVSVADGILNINSANDATISGAVVADSATGKLNIKATNGNVTFSNGTMAAKNGGAIKVDGAGIQVGALDTTTGGAITLGTNVTNSVNVTGVASVDGALDVVAKSVTMNTLKSTGGATNVTATSTNPLQINTVDVSGGVVTLNGAKINSTTMSLTGGTTNLASGEITVSGAVTVKNGDVAQGGSVGVLVLKNDGTFVANSLAVTDGALVVDGNNVTYDITNGITLANGIAVNSGTSTINAKSANIGGTVQNAGTLALNTTNDLSLGAINNTGTLTMKSNTGVIDVASITNTTGIINATTNSLTSTGAINSGGKLYQNYTGTMGAGDINIVSDNHVLTASNLTVGGINQTGTMTIKSSDVTVNGNIAANDLHIVANPANDWLDVNVNNGSILGGTSFVGLEHMHVGGNYTFDDNSSLHAVVLPTPGVVIDSTPYNYWSTVSLADDNTFGQITNAENYAAPLISVDGQFISTVTNAGSELSDAPLANGQIGIDIFNMVDSGTAIWLVHADNGLSELSEKIRNLYVNFCNQDGTKCFKYFDSSIAENANVTQTEANLPAYLSVRDIDNDGVTDSIYVVFDSRFGGPVGIFKIQPIVKRVDDHTRGEYDAAGALDDLIEGGLLDAKFGMDSPLETIPVVFNGTNLEDLATELYNRMERYTETHDGTPLARFSRLVQPSEVELLAGNISLDEHTLFRDFEDRMLDEFIWNRHRSLRKAWLDVDYGMFFQKTADGKHADGDRFSILGGYDWQHTSTLILGLTGHVAHTTSQDKDVIDLTYRPSDVVTGNVDFDVSDTDIGVGAYMMKILGTKTRIYGNGFFDLHLLDVSRNQNFVSSISGSGTAFSLISEWGFLHDWLNQYIVGNLYARVGYNFGFSIKEEAAGDEYMRLKSDGYFIFTPGYSLIAQKRMYPTSWFQIRPYASIGVEYDVLGAPEYAEYKFGPAKRYTKYHMETDPLWVNIGGGVELLSASGFQVGLDYRYQYNNNLQLHKIKLSGSYRF